MLGSNVIIELQNKYRSGERNFQKIELRRAELRGLNLSYADLSGADLSYANLRDANLRGANLSEVYLNEADLTGANLQGANLQGAFLMKAYLIKTNLQESNLSQSYLTGAYLTKSDLSKANLSGAYLNSIKISGTNLTEARYDRKTHFDMAFDAKKNGMIEILPQQNIPTSIEPKTTLEDLINTFHHLSQISIHYLGHSMTTRYWESARPDSEWLNQFQFNRSSRIVFSGDLQQPLDPSEIQLVQEWVSRFIKSCSQIIQDFPMMLDTKQIVFLPSTLGIYPEKGFLAPTVPPNQLSQQTNSIQSSPRPEILTLQT